MEKQKNILMIQPNLSLKRLPYPYFVEKDGKVQRQDFWKGNPYKFIGLATKDEQKIVVPFYKFFKTQRVLIITKGLRPVFADAEDNFYTDLRFCEFKMIEGKNEDS